MHTISIFGVKMKKQTIYLYVCVFIQIGIEINASPTHTIQLQIVTYNDLLFFFVECKCVCVCIQTSIRCLESSVIAVKTVKIVKLRPNGKERDRKNMHLREMFNQRAHFSRDRERKSPEMLAHSNSIIVFDVSDFFLFQFVNYCTLAKHKSIKNERKIVVMSILLNRSLLQCTELQFGQN